MILPDQLHPHLPLPAFLLLSLWSLEVCCPLWNVSTTGQTALFRVWQLERQQIPPPTPACTLWVPVPYAESEHNRTCSRRPSLFRSRVTWKGWGTVELRLPPPGMETSEGSSFWTWTWSN